MAKKKNRTIKTEAGGLICAVHHCWLETCPNCKAPKARCEACREGKDSPLHPHCYLCCNDAATKSFRPPKPKIGDIVSVPAAGSNPLWASNATRIYEGD
jgi:hypothetical protein